MKRCFGCKRKKKNSEYVEIMENEKITFSMCKSCRDSLPLSIEEIREMNNYLIETVEEIKPKNTDPTDS